MKKHYLFTFLTFFLFLGCNNYTNETTKLNTIVSKYNKIIPEEPHLFFVTSNFYCKGCVQSIYVELGKNLTNNNKSHVTIISKNKVDISKEVLSKVNFINDSLDIVDKEFRAFSNVTIFETNKGKVVNFKNLGDSRNLSLPEFALNRLIKFNKSP